MKAGPEGVAANPMHVGLLLAIVPVLGLGTAFLIHGETLNLLGGAGVLLVLLGIGASVLHTRNALGNLHSKYTL